MAAKPNHKIINFLARTVMASYRLLSWLHILLVPIIICGVLGGVAFLALDRSILGAVVWGVSILIGTICGGVWAERVRKKEGLEAFSAKLQSTPDLDRTRNSSNSPVPAGQEIGPSDPTASQKKPQP